VDVAASPKAKGWWRAEEEEWCVVEETEVENPECEPRRKEDAWIEVSIFGG